MEANERGAMAERSRQAIETLIPMMRLHHRIVERRIDGLGVHHSQHRLLMKLSRIGRTASQKEIAERMEVSPACVARMLKYLSAEGLVERAEGEDSRRNEVSITGAGLRIVEDSRKIFDGIREEMFTGLSEEELDALNGLLSRIQGNLLRMAQGDSLSSLPVSPSRDVPDAERSVNPQ